MPRIPGYEPQVKTQGVATPRMDGLSTEAFGAGIGKALQGIGNDAFKVLQGEQEKTDASVVMGAVASVNERKVRLLTDPDKGILNRQGKDAIGIEKQALEQYDKDLSEVRMGLASDRQRLAFDKYIKNDRNEVLLQVNRHEAGETKKYRVSEANAAVDSSFNVLNTLVGSPDLWRNELTRTQTLARAALAVQGYGPDSETAKEKLAEVNSKAYEFALRQKMLKNPAEAKGYLDAVSDKLLPDTRAKLEKEIDVDISPMRGVEVATKFFQENPNRPLSELRELVKKEIGSDPRAWSAANTELASLDANRDEEKRERTQSAYDAVELDLTNARERKAIVSLKDIDPKKWAALKAADPGKAESIIAKINSDAEEYREKQRRLAKETKEERENRTLGNYVSLLLNPDLLTQTDLTKTWRDGDLSDGQYKELAGKKREVLDNPDKRGQLQSESDLVKSIAKNAKIAEGTENYTAFISSVQRERQAFKVQNGRDMTNDELSKAARGQLYKVDVKGSIVDRPAYQITYKDIPIRERDAIIKQLVPRKYTEQQVVDIYVEAKRKQGAI